MRFGVASPSGTVSVTWKCFTQVGSGKADVYVACRSLAAPLKLSLHESGRWHVAFDSEQFPRLFEPSSQPDSRFSRIWQQPAPLAEGLVLACRIHFPWYAIDRRSGANERKVVWLPAPPEGKSTEVAIFLSARPFDATTWPGRDSMGTKLVGHLPTDSGITATLVHHYTDSISTAFPPLPPGRYFNGATEEDLVGKSNRALGWGQHTDGSVFFQEGPVSVVRRERI